MKPELSFRHTFHYYAVHVYKIILYNRQLHMTRHFTVSDIQPAIQEWCPWAMIQLKIAVAFWSFRR